MQKAEKLTSRIIGEAQQISGEMIQAAQSGADENLALARTQAAEILEQARKDASLAAEEQKKRKLSAIKSELRKKILATRRALIESVFEQALERLAGMPADKQVAMLAPLVVQASPSGEGEILLAKKDAAEFGDKLLAAATKLYAGPVALKISDKHHNGRGGFILRIGDIEYNNTYEALLKATKEELEGKVAAVLFSGGNDNCAVNAYV